MGTGDAGETAGDGEAAALGGEGLGAPEEVAQRGEGVEDLEEARMRVTGHGGDAEFGTAVVEGDGGDIGLTVGSPVDFNVGGRWDAGGEAEVGAEAEAANAWAGAVEASPRAKAG